MRERVLLLGEPASRPEGLERALTRAGFSLADGGVGGVLTRADLVIIAASSAGAGLERALTGVRGDAWTGVPVIVLLAGSERGGVARAFALGATDVLTAPLNLDELSARLESRLRIGAELRRAASAVALHADLFRAIEQIATARDAEAMLETLTLRLGRLLGAAHCACLDPTGDRRYARLVAVHENPSLRDVSVDLFRYPEAVEAAISCRSVYAPEVLRDRLFLTHLAQWPDSPEVHEIESAAAVPLLVNRRVRAVLVVRTRRGDGMLTAEQLDLMEQLVNATGALVEREERRGQLIRPEAASSGTDPLTRCASREALERQLEEELARAVRYDLPLAFALLRVNALPDRRTDEGWSPADRLLAELGAILLQEVRLPDFVARSAAREFALLLPSTRVEGARTLLARVSARVAQLPLSQLGAGEPPGLVAGVLPLPHEGLTRPAELIAAAQLALSRGAARSADGVGLLDPVAA